ncbi:Retrotransposon, unclassified-like protein [Gossypium australe]|uniref:Retrotransposon, unclassified-like protein n=1 Tax=Gossypium australe TaxID=47621 RepID=A0A5B6X7H3_9ROSI|nr:Retrotransposon, unclassified-like protein [Gossypium australe]
MLSKTKCTGGLGLNSKTGLVYFISASLSFSQSFKSSLLPFFRYTISESWFLPFIYLEKHLQRSGVDWGRDFVTVDETTSARILYIPIYGSSSEDMMGIDSGYRVLTTTHLQNITHTSSNDDDYKEFYKALWSLNILEKIKIHSWRLVNNLVPHFGNLARRTLCVEVVYPLCKADLEDSDYLMWSCGILQCVWASIQVTIPSFEASLCYKNRFVRTFSAADEQ